MFAKYSVESHIDAQHTNHKLVKQC